MSGKQEADRPWRHRGIFITATFRDMHAERDYLRTHIFPELGERLSRNRIHVEPIDLRWGVDASETEQDRDLIVLKVCLGEIGRCVPYLIGVIGDRYGYIPSDDRLMAAAAEAGLSVPVQGKSITELEIDFGALSSADRPFSGFFYIRNPLPYDQMRPTVAARYSDAYDTSPGAKDRHQKLFALKERLERKFPERTRHYSVEWDVDTEAVSGLGKFGEMVIEDLWAELAGGISQQPKPDIDWREGERWSLERFVEDRSRIFIGRKEEVASLISFATSKEVFVYNEIAADRVEAGDLDEALDALVKAVTLCDEDPDGSLDHKTFIRVGAVRREMAEELLARGEIGSALRTYEEAISALERAGATEAVGDTRRIFLGLSMSFGDRGHGENRPIAKRIPPPGQAQARH